MRMQAAIMIFLGLILHPAGLLAKPRVVSIDSCADQLVLGLAGDEQILALSRDSRGVFSYFRERAEKFPAHLGTAEEIFLLNPDIVLATGAGDAALAETLRRLGYRVISTGLSRDIEGALESLKQVGDLLDQTEKARALIKKARQGIDALKKNRKTQRPGFYVSPSGITTGPGTFLHEVLELGGVSNILETQGVEGWSRLDLETIVRLKPEVMVTSFFDSTEGSANAWRFSAHPVMREAMDEVKVIDIPSRYLSCPAWFAIEGAALIRKQLEGGQ